MACKDRVQVSFYPGYLSTKQLVWVTWGIKTHCYLHKTVHVTAMLVNSVQRSCSSLKNRRRYCGHEKYIILWIEWCTVIFSL